ncbi:hypothetical protein DER44DRAFT_892946 [Fusarium oxysporum]|nr:hypothetical protein DER44DRAFT_892946 [Fusarium oxysporum]
MKKEDFFKWNPEVHQDCSGLFVGYRYCVGVKSNSTGNLEWETSTPPFTPPPEPTSHKPTKLTPSGSNFTPTPAHGPMPTDCVNYHQAEADESCRDILKTYNYLSKDQFFKYNPSELPMPPTVTTTPSDVPRGSPKDCKAWYYTTGGETCEQLANMFGTFNIKGFIAMNPSVLDDCGDIEDNTWYCVAGPDTPTTRTADVTAPTRPATAMPTQSGIATGCERYWLVSKKDTCKSIRRANSILLDKLLTWNPALGRVSRSTGNGGAVYAIASHHPNIAGTRLSQVGNSLLTTFAAKASRIIASYGSKLSKIQNAVSRGLWDDFFLAAKRVYVEGVEVLYGTNTVHPGSKALLDNLSALLLPQRLSIIPGLEDVWSVGTHEHQGRAAPNQHQLEKILHVLDTQFPSLSILHLGIRLDLPIVQMVNSRPTMQRAYLDGMIRILDEFVKRRKGCLRKPFILSITTSAWRDLERCIRTGGYPGMWLSCSRIWRCLLPGSKVTSGSDENQNATADKGYWIWRDHDAIRRSANSMGRGHLLPHTL